MKNNLICPFLVCLIALLQTQVVCQTIDSTTYSVNGTCNDYFDAMQNHPILNCPHKNGCGATVQLAEWRWTTTKRIKKNQKPDGSCDIKFNIKVELPDKSQYTITLYSWTGTKSGCLEKKYNNGKKFLIDHENKHIKIYENAIIQVEKKLKTLENINCDSWEDEITNAISNEILKIRNLRDSLGVIPI